MKRRLLGIALTTALIIAALLVLGQLAPELDGTERLALAIGCAVVVDMAATIALALRDRRGSRS
jgi:uncharacterized membrane protein